MAQGKSMKEIFIKILEFLGLAYWIEITTDSPQCTYYFGPFINKQEAEIARSGYVEDLQQEDAQNITTKIERLKVDYTKLTIFDELEEGKNFKRIASLSSQLF
jgi:hypothetical protein